MQSLYTRIIKNEEIRIFLHNDLVTAFPVHTGTLRNEFKYNPTKSKCYNYTYETYKIQLRQLSNFETYIFK